MYYKRIKELREDNDRLQKELAHILGITQAQYSNIEKGVSDITGEKIIKLSSIYKVSADYILGLSDIKEKAR